MKQCNSGTRFITFASTNTSIRLGLNMNDVEQSLFRIETELSEWKEELGEQFPCFLNHMLMSRLMKAEEEIEFLRRCLNSQEAMK
jgi:hypothetical protein